MSEAPPYDVIILSAVASNLIACVNALRAAEPTLPPWHIIVVDDGARREAEATLPGVRWIAGEQPFVYARNANLGIAASTRDVILLNDDALLTTPGGFGALARAARAGVADSSRPLGAISSAVTGLIGNRRQKPRPGGGVRHETIQLCFVCTYLPRETLDRVGPLDQRFVGYGFEDNDYCDRIRAAGLRLAIHDGCIVDHSGHLPSTFRTRADFPALSARNHQLYREKRTAMSIEPLPPQDVLCVMRIKNEAAYIGEVIESVLPLCRRVLILDDHSEDRTPEICRSFGDRVELISSPFTGLDEARDKNFLLPLIAARAPDWVLWIDGDEVLERNGPEHIRTLITQRSAAAVYSLRIAYLWDDPAQVRIDGLFGRFARPSLFRWRDQPIDRLVFPQTTHGNLHCGNVPRGLIGATSNAPVRLKHYGYLSDDQRRRKYAWYTRIDPGNRAEDEYRHLIGIPGARHAPGPPVLVAWDG